jgi:hypothetical protein
VGKDTKTLIDFKNMASQEWDNWSQWQDTFGPEAPVEDRKPTASSPSYGSGNWSTNFGLESTGEDGVDSCFSSSNYFIFDDPFIPLGDPNLSWQFSPTPTMEFDAPPLQDAGNVVHGKTPTFEKAACPSLQGTSTPDMPVESKDASKRPRTVGSNPSRSKKLKNKKSQPCSLRANSQRRDSHNAIEKRYRTGINEKIDRLRQAIPPPVRKNSELESSEEDDGSTTAKESKSSELKDGKGAVLVRALGYIKGLEANATKLCEEAVILETRLKSFENLAMDGTVSLDHVALSPQALIVKNEPNAAFEEVSI